MATSVNVYPEGWSKTGNTVPVDQYAFNFRIEWIDDEGVEHEWEGEVKFPNALADVPTPWLKEMLLELTMRATRVKLGVDSEDV